jgi:hypothetical protein
MFPLSDENPTELFPFFTLIIIGACAAAWFLIQASSPRK